MSLIENITNNFNTTKKAAVYYKVEPFYTNVGSYTHTNNWEILQSIKILNEKGYAVDLIDRGNHDWTPNKTYDLFLGLGVGNTGKNFVRHANISGAKKKVLLSMGPQPDVSNELVLERYKMFKERTGYNAPPMRTVAQVTGEEFIKIADTADFIFNIGEKDTCSYNSFLKYGKPVLNFLPSVSPLLHFNPEWLQTRDINSFLCFAGNGFICKGVDLLVESFLDNPSKTLHICGPNTEAAFFNYYGEKINSAPNIFYHGFVKPGGESFNQLSSKCSFVIFHSAAEGCCTSVATAIKAGLVPVINPWTGINVTDEGISMKEGGDIIKTITESVNKVSVINAGQYKQFLEKTLEKSKLFSQDSFTKTYTEALDVVIGEIKQ
jgi:hypothetical protein